MIVPRVSLGAADARMVGAERDLMGEQLTRLAALNVFFAHQSVGMNLLDGVREIAADYPGIPLRILESTADLSTGAVRHAFVPENGDPEKKIEGFRHLLDSGIGANSDVAFLKLCYSDFSATTDPISLFATYQRTMAAIRRDYPKLLLVHVTVPLTSVSGRANAGAAVMRLLGRTLPGIAENAVREEFSELLRYANAGASTVFDLARLESTTPTGERDLRPWRGRLVPCLHPGYTDDGGHLNATGRRRLGRALIAFLTARARSS